MKLELTNAYYNNIKAFKSVILNSRYKATTLVNKELLILYLVAGEFISSTDKSPKWGSKIIDTLSTGLQTELPGLRGFSASDLKRMRFFYEAWQEYLAISPLANKTSNTLPDEYQGVLPDVETLKNLMN